MEAKVTPLQDAAPQLASCQVGRSSPPGNCRSHRVVSGKDASKVYVCMDKSYLMRPAMQLNVQASP